MISGFINYTINGENSWQRSLNGNQEFSFFKSKDYLVSTTFAYGNKADWSFILGELFYGPSFVLGKKKGAKVKYALGINIESQILFSPSDIVGFDIFCNLNLYESFACLRIAIFIR